jgi:hypothetical protein
LPLIRQGIVLREDQEFVLGLAKFKITVRHSSVVAYMRLEFGIEA